MARSRWLVLVCALVAVALVGRGATAPQADTSIPGELLVQFARSATASQRDAAITSRGAQRIRRFANIDVDHVRLPPGLTATAATAVFARLPGVVAVQPNYRRHAIQNQSAPPNDPFWLDGSLWGLAKIQAQQAWTTFGAGDGSVVVASIDTGIDYTHPDLAANMWHNPNEIPGNGIDDDGNGYVDDVYGINTANHTSDPFDDQGHGTHTAGTLAASGNNGLGVTGVNWNAKILSCKFLDASGSGTDAGAIECFNYITALKNRGVNIRISSNSWGESRGSGPPSTVLQAAIEAAGAAGILNVFGAGNDGTDNDASPFDPASYPSASIVAVASSSATDRRSFFSNYGATSVDLAAPGEDILSTYFGGGYESLSGTSMATPHVAGAAALLASLDPTLSVPALKALLLDNVDQSSRWNGVVVSGGRLNVFKAASAVGVTPNSPPTVSMTSPASGFSIKAPAMVELNAVASDSDGSVTQVAFFANGSPIGATSSSPYSVNWNATVPGTYAITAVATDDRGSTATSAAVTVNILANAPPVVTVSSPAEGATFTSPATITITGAATDSDGSISQVTFFANGTAVGTVVGAPYSVSWAAPMGAWTLTASATDNEGATTVSPPVHVIVNPMPGRLNVALATNAAIASASSTLASNYPASGAINGDRRGLNWGAGGGWNDGTANASPDWIEVDFHGSKLIEEVDLFSMQDNYASPIEPTPTMTFTTWGVRSFDVQYWTGAAWAIVPGGSVVNNNLVWRQVAFVPVVTNKIRVNITAALNGYSRVMEVEAWGVPSGVNIPPSVAMTTPADGSTLTSPATVTIGATASDDDGTVASVAFFANGVQIGSASTAPYSIVWNVSAIGTYSLTAVATDNQGASTTSAPITVTIAANTPPTVSLTSPSAGASFSAPANIIVSASAADPGGSVASVAFFANGVSIGTDTTSPFSITWSNVAAGSYTLTAIATDNMGATTTSSPVGITVVAAPLHTNVALAANGGVATASSIYSPSYGPSGAINGDRKGLNFGAGGGWNDGTPNTTPDWIQVDFAGTKTIGEIDVFSMQDNYGSPAEPTPTMTFTSWGLRAFDVQYWNGSTWVTVSGGSITNNNLVWRQVTFTPIATTKIRVFITGTLNGYSRMVELEAWDNNAPPPPPPPNPSRINMALAANGGVASASSSYSPSYGPGGAINGDRKGLNFGAGGGWNDGTANASPDWIEVDFASAKTIDEIDVFSMQDNYSSPSDPTPAMTFTSFGLRAFEVQFWTGTAWAAVPGGAITNNNLVWRQVAFQPITTTKIRIFITGALNGYSRVMEVEAWGVDAAGGQQH